MQHCDVYMKLVLSSLANKKMKGFFSINAELTTSSCLR